MSALRHQWPGSKAASLNFTIKPTYKINGVGCVHKCQSPKDLVNAAGFNQCGGVLAL